jgi:tRNA-splicing ligase RtcB
MQDEKMEQLKRIDPYRLRLEPGGRRLVPATVYLPEEAEVERGAVKQLADATTIDGQAVVLATPDIHQGYGVPIGSVFGSERFVSPAAVGYDINCGMRLLSTPLAAAEADVVQLAGSIRRDIPLGEGRTNLAVSPKTLEYLVEQGVPGLARAAEREPELARAVDPEDLAWDLERIEDGGAMQGDAGALPRRAIGRGQGQLATLGGGNHFIELQRVQRLDDPDLARRWGLFQGQLVVMLHSGSRGFGHEVGGHYMREAHNFCTREGLPMPSRDLAYLPLSSGPGESFLGAMAAAANYAFLNRQLMAGLVRRNLRYLLGQDLELPTIYDVPHNIAKFESHDGRRLCVHRKGATRAFPAARMRETPFADTGQPVLIPGSMGTASYLLVGADSGAESLHSVNHGAGRVLSRKAAAGVVRRGRVVRPGKISDKDFKQAMRGVHLICANKNQIKEEAPQAYKDIDQVIDTVVGAGLARVVARMVPLAVLKG